MNSHKMMPKEHLLRLHPDDNVAVLLCNVERGQTLKLGDHEYAAPAALAMGHKIAICPIGPGDKIFKYGAPIGSATRSIHRGEHVHVHNMKSDFRMRHSSREEEAHA